MGEALARPVEIGPPADTLASGVCRGADFADTGNAVLLAVVLSEPEPGARARELAELPLPERANTPRPGPNSTRASVGCDPDVLIGTPISACTSGHRAGISRSGGAGTGWFAHSASASATSIGSW